MAKARLLAPWVGEERRSALYHVVSRTIHQKFLLGKAEKEQFVKLMRLYEEFCGVRVLRLKGQTIFEKVRVLRLKEIKRMD